VRESRLPAIRGKDYSVLPDSGYARREKQRRTPR
jgi:hypothetical protein